MSQNQLHNIDKLEADLWEAADQLRANSKLTSTEYCMPVLGVIFLRHAANRFDAATKQIQEDQVSGKMPKRGRPYAHWRYPGDGRRSQRRLVNLTREVALPPKRARSRSPPRLLAASSATSRSTGATVIVAAVSRSRTVAGIGARSSWTRYHVATLRKLMG